jgi:hypothetical protein
VAGKDAEGVEWQVYEVARFGEEVDGVGDEVLNDAKYESSHFSSCVAAGESFCRCPVLASA